ncbi:MAG TPA: hypothetical protein DEG09_06315 [Marinilabiliaceae bacterium]|nr:hypothetical protein [Marinilabiliaceae bacterium]
MIFPPYSYHQFNAFFRMNKLLHTKYITYLPTAFKSQGLNVNEKVYHLILKKFTTDDTQKVYHQ